MEIERTAKVGFGLARFAFGAFALAAPTQLGSSWIGAEDAGRSRVKVVLRALGVRDVALGAGTAWGAAVGPATPWLAASVLADLGDMAATIESRDRLPEQAVRNTVALTAAAAVAGAVLIALEQR